MKKLISYMLACAMLLALSAGAFAYEDTDPPQWEEWGYGSLEEYLEAWDETEEEYYEEIAFDVALQNQFPAWKEAFLEAHPGWAEEKLAEAEDSDREYYNVWYSDEFDTFDDWYIDFILRGTFAEEWQAKRLLEKRVSLGGPAEGIGVMWNGSYIAFPDAQPEAKDGRTMIPVRAFMEAAGAEVGYEDGRVTLTLEDGRVISFVIGEKTATLTQNGETGTIEMDVATYAHDDRTYVPVRFFSEALGCEVGWDSEYKTAVVMDTAALPAELEARFSLLLGWLEKTASEEKELPALFRTDFSLTGDVTVFDSLNGDRAGDFGLRSSLTADTEALNAEVTFSWDYSGMMDLLDYLTTTMAAENGEVPEALAEAAPLIEALQISDFALLLSGEEESAWLGGAAPEALLPYFEMEKDGDGPLWLGGTVPFRAMLEELDPAQLEEALSAYNPLEELLDPDDIESWGRLNELLDLAESVLGDEHFTQIPGGLRTEADLKALITEAAPEAASALAFADLTAEIELRDDGGLFLAVHYNALAARCDFSFTLSENAMDTDLKLHVRNTAALTLASSFRLAETDEKPRTAPPADAVILDLTESMATLADSAIPAQY